MMAATEVRAVWHRTVNRCFVQEDAKRVPKLACCQSSRATSKLNDLGLAIVADESLQNAASIMKKTCMEGMLEAYSKKACSEMTKHETMEADSVGCLVSKQTKDFSLDSDYSWIEDDNDQPWWKTTDRNELACLVSRKSLSYVENCDLPPPRKKYLGEQPCDISHYNIKPTCCGCEAKSSVSSIFTVQAKESLDSGLMLGKLEPPSNKGHLYFSSDKSSSYTTIHEGKTEQAFEGDHTKAQLMEALCHSQTRAREAEEVAKQAYADKEHIIALFFIQASQLFAYKQWYRLLQLETLNTEIKNEDKPISTIFQETLPSMSYECMKPLTRKRKFDNVKQEKLRKPISDASTYAVAFALGLSLVGAGLLLGWTVGWMVPRL
ncbi:uncharacterized protein [Cicer arietinum]|uniref:Uncharacterized protein LOC101490666 isoform X2 n=1 Tax=Cicer arietinum TaxID=3827 RepID=A0A1S2YVM7_CICAR|nr:uncharacterized protein LOC101490666 isoform X2 [Cicer arietinum]